MRATTLNHARDDKQPLLRVHGLIWGSVAGVMVLVSALTSAAYWAGQWQNRDNGLDVRMTALEAKLDRQDDTVQAKLDQLNDKLTNLAVGIARLQGDRGEPPTP